MATAPIRIILGDPVTGVDIADPNGIFECDVSLVGGDGTFDIGNPVPVVQTVESGLQDGTLVQWLKDDNRTVQLAFKPTGANAQALSAAIEGTIVPLLNGPTNLTIYPPDGGSGSIPAVFEVWTSELKYVTNDYNEIPKPKMKRYYTLNLTAQPYVRSLNPVQSTALPGTGTGQTVLDNGTSVAGAPVTGAWTSTLGTVTTTGTVLNIPFAATSSSFHANAKKSFASRNFTATPYVGFDIVVPYGMSIPQPGFVNPVTLTASNGAIGTFYSAYPSSVAGYTTFWFYFATPPTACTSLTADIQANVNTQYLNTFTLDQLVIQGNAPGASGVGSDAPVRYIPMVGSKRTPGSLRLDLGATPTPGTTPDWLVYTAPLVGLGGGYSPVLSYTNTLFAGATGQPRIQTLTFNTSNWPRGGYNLVAELSGTFNSAGPLPAPITMAITVAQTGAKTRTFKRVFTLMNDALIYNSGGGGTILPQALYNLGPMDFPIGDVPPGATGANTTVTLSVSNSVNMRSFRVFAFYLGDGAALTMGPANARYIRLDTAIIGKPYTSVYAGSVADGSNAVAQGGYLRSWGAHKFIPPNQVVLASGVTTADYFYYPRWHGYPAA